MIEYQHHEILDAITIARIIPEPKDPSGFRIGPLWRCTFYAFEGPVYAYVASPLLLLRPLVTRLMRDIEILDAIEAENLRRLATASGCLVRAV